MFSILSTFNVHSGFQTLESEENHSFLYELMDRHCVGTDGQGTISNFRELRIQLERRINNNAHNHSYYLLSFYYVPGTVLISLAQMVYRVIL